jgi:hypothetical protein
MEISLPNANADSFQKEDYLEDEIYALIYVYL